MICAISIIFILLLVFAFELAMLLYVVKVFYNVDTQISATQTVNDNEVFSVGELLDGEGNIDLTTPPMSASQPWNFNNQVNTHLQV